MWIGHRKEIRENERPNVLNINHVICDNRYWQEFVLPKRNRELGTSVPREGSWVERL